MNIDPGRELKGWELKGSLCYVKGLIFLAAANVAFLIDDKPVPTVVWFWVNGFGAALVLLGTYLVERSQRGASRLPTRRS